MPSKKTPKATEKMTSANQSAAAATMPIIDWEKAREVINGSLTEAVELLRQLLDYIPGALKQIRKAAKANDLTKLLEVVHKLHGACSYCGVPRLKATAKSLESAIRNHNESLSKELTLQLEQELLLLLKAAEQDENLNFKL